LREEDVAGRFRRDRYVVLRGFLTGFALDAAYEYARDAAEGPRATLEDPQVPGTPTLSADPVMETLLVKLNARVERLLEMSLFPTYSFCRVYKRGAVLDEHMDRPACEVSVSLSLGYEAKRPWPLWVRRKDRPTPISLEAGDALAYQGPRILHWRRAFDGELAAQVFLHYVQQDGEYAHLRFDGRPGLALPADPETLPEPIRTLDLK